MNVSRQDVQLRSYLIWEREGQPQGRDWDHWFRAESELAREPAELKKAVTSTSPRTRGSKSQKESKPAKKPAAKKT